MRRRQRSLQPYCFAAVLLVAITRVWPQFVALTPPVPPPAAANYRPLQGVTRSHRLSEANWPALLSHRVASDYRARNPGQDPRDYYTLAGTACGLGMHSYVSSGRRALHSLSCTPKGAHEALRQCGDVGRGRRKVLAGKTCASSCSPNASRILVVTARRHAALVALSSAPNEYAYAYTSPACDTCP